MAKSSALPDAWIEKLFNLMEDRYGSLWADRYGAFPRDRVKRTWGSDLADMSRDELARGAEACRDRRYPPTLPEFRALCRKEMDFESAFCEAIEQLRQREHGNDKWSHPAIYWAAVSIGSFDMRNATWGGIKARWTATLQAELEKREWPDVPLPMVALPAPGKTSVSPEEAKRRIEAMKESLVKKMAFPARDGEEQAGISRSQSYRICTGKAWNHV